jgi:hypothetical protein
LKSRGRAAGGAWLGARPLAPCASLRVPCGARACGLHGRTHFTRFARCVQTPAVSQRTMRAGARRPQALRSSAPKLAPSPTPPAALRHRGLDSSSANTVVAKVGASGCVAARVWTARSAGLSACARIRALQALTHGRCLSAVSDSERSEFGRGAERPSTAADPERSAGRPRPSAATHPLAPTFAARSLSHDRGPRSHRQSGR